MTLKVRFRHFLTTRVNICESQIKKIFLFYWFFYKNEAPVDSGPQNSTTEVTLMYILLSVSVFAFGHYKHVTYTLRSQNCNKRIRVHLIFWSCELWYRYILKSYVGHFKQKLVVHTTSFQKWPNWTCKRCDYVRIGQFENSYY